MENSQKIAEEYLTLLKQRETLDAQVKNYAKEIFVKGQELYDKMEQESVDEIVIENVKFMPKVEQDFALAENIEIRRWDNLPDWFAWLKEIGEEGLIKVLETVNAQTRKKFLKEWVGENNPLPLFIREVFNNTIKYNKNEVKRLVNGG